MNGGVVAVVVSVGIIALPGLALVAFMTIMALRAAPRAIFDGWYALVLWSMGHPAEARGILDTWIVREEVGDE